MVVPGFYFQEINCCFQHFVLNVYCLHFPHLLEFLVEIGISQDLDDKSICHLRNVGSFPSDMAKVIPSRAQAIFFNVEIFNSPGDNRRQFNVLSI
jgi:hypothetical protein